MPQDLDLLVRHQQRAGREPAVGPGVDAAGDVEGAFPQFGAVVEVGLDRGHALQRPGDPLGAGAVDQPAQVLDELVRTGLVEGPLVADGDAAVLEPLALPQVGRHALAVRLGERPDDLVVALLLGGARRQVAHVGHAQHHGVEVVVGQ